jgi:hypothetical protein
MLCNFICSPFIKPISVAVKVKLATLAAALSYLTPAFSRRRIYFKLINATIEETGGWRKLHNEELHNLYSSPSVIRMIKSRRTR